MSWKPRTIFELLTTKGDVAVHDGTSPIRLPVGTDAQVLTADAAEASGVKWADATGGGGGGGNAAYAETIGDGTNTSYVVTHSLGTTDLAVQLWDLTGADPVEATGDATSITATSTNAVTIVFPSAPATDSYRVVILSDGGSSSGGGVANVLSSVDAAPASPNAMDDEFDDESFDGTLWTDINLGTVTKAERDHSLIFETTGGHGTSLRGVQQAAPAGDWTIRAKLLGPPGVFEIEHYLFVAKSTTERLYSIGWHGSAAGIKAHQRTSITAAAAAWGVTDVGGLWNYVYVELSWDDTAGTLGARWSLDGTAWSSDMASTLEASWTPGIVGLGVRNATSRAIDFGVDWFRRIA
jgi:hypothetical protein